ncbi:polyprenyl synthetase family protein [Paenibacillus sp. SC116]|uniref:polyprenyl synthetase family protein n=1 Tax=Paenibacillus sp. SC116 TaxID=2968986 RepID=UPI00215AFD40|nr:polyprenyl synthetase family protein [Paenibacillus sp. SC116]MCR8844655.1 polyprenyl synthetase family protein [Paenibacillus sp. SC116]
MEHKLVRIDTIMKDLIDESFTQSMMRQYAHEFLQDKRSEAPSRFGLLAEYHYNMFGGADEGIYSACAAVELFLLASDVIDDLQDQDNGAKRWMQLPMPLSLNVALGLLQLVPLAMKQCRSTMNGHYVCAALEMMNQQMVVALNGQMADLENDIADIPAYIEMVEQKSASMFIMACMTGVMLATGEWNGTVAAYAKELGLSSQLKNDMKDLYQLAIKNDFHKRKRTAPLLYLAEAANEAEYKWIKDYVDGHSDHISEEQICQLHEACEKTGTFIASAVRMRVHYYQFQDLFKQHPVTAPYFEEFKAIFLGVEPTEAAPQ